MDKLSLTARGLKSVFHLKWSHFLEFWPNLAVQTHFSENFICSKRIETLNYFWKIKRCKFTSIDYMPSSLRKQMSLAMGLLIPQLIASRLPPCVTSDNIKWIVESMKSARKCVFEMLDFVKIEKVSGQCHDLKKCLYEPQILYSNPWLLKTACPKYLRIIKVTNFGMKKKQVSCYS